MPVDKKLLTYSRGMYSFACRITGPSPGHRQISPMKTASKAYNDLWTLIDKESIHLKTLDFSAVCERIGANEKELEAILLRELGYTGYELLVELRRRHFQTVTEPDSA